MKVNQFAIDYPDVDQMDFNPVFAYADGVKIADAQIVFWD
ncbi:MAG: hypothetical protein RBG13Loki_4163 [Promethearchaeota archaeon CR_4]|nr:MAG: hypothetical protein RBG13Loki_4163 [Candidatus Lokiarchaeota archaeon CR_4]